jgi:hypothetical protein
VTTYTLREKLYEGRRVVIYREVAKPRDSGRCRIRHTVAFRSLRLTEA